MADGRLLFPRQSSEQRSDMFASTGVSVDGAMERWSVLDLSCYHMTNLYRKDVIFQYNMMFY